MPIQGYGGTLFTGASAGCLVGARNLAPGIVRHDGTQMITLTNNQGGIDLDAQVRLAPKRGAMCAGLTAAWIISFLNDPNEGAANTVAFSRHHEVLRFQGAYIQASEHRTRLEDPMAVFKAFAASGLDTNVKSCGGKISAIVRAADLPSRPSWAAYFSLRGHAIGVGRTNGSYFIMDPNFGLFQFTTADLCAREVQNLYTLYRTQKGHMEPMRMFFYRV